MLELQDVTLAQGDFRLTADLRLPDRGICAVIGPSGAGKSTLLNAVAGFVPLARGRVLWQGRDISGLAPGDRPVAMLFQDNNLFPHLSIAQNVGLGLRPALRLTSTEAADVARALDAVGLLGMATRRPRDLSGGQQSRAALARILVGQAPLVLLDEPFAALGPGLRAEMLDLVAARLSGRSVLMVSHSPEDARRVASHVVLVAEGRAQAPQPTQAMFDAPPAALRDYLGF